MSYNIDSIAVMRIAGAVIDRVALDIPTKDRPEICFLDELSTELPFPALGPTFGWCGEGSGHSLDILIRKVVPLIRGEIDALVTWEGGDSIEAWRIKDGKITSVDVLKASKNPAVIEAIFATATQREM